MLGLGVGVCDVRSDFSPLSLPGLVAWWNAGNGGSTLEERTSPTTPADNGDPIGTLLDLSGNGYHVAASADNQRSTREVSGGAAWASFDGVDDTLRRAATVPFSDYDELLIALIVRVPTGQGSSAVMEAGDAFSNAGGWRIFTTSTGGILVNGSVGTSGSNSGGAAEVAMPADTWASVVARLRAGERNYISRNAGIQTDLSSNNIPGGANNFSDREINIGMRDATSIPTGVDIKQICIIGGPLSDQQVSQIEQYFYDMRDT